MTEAVRSQVLTREARIRTQVSLRGICVAQNALKLSFLRILSNSPSLRHFANAVFSFVHHQPYIILTIY